LRHEKKGKGHAVRRGGGGGRAVLGFFLARNPDPLLGGKGGARSTLEGGEKKEKLKDASPLESLEEEKKKEAGEGRRRRKSF